MIRTNIFLFCILLNISVSGILTADYASESNDTQISANTSEQSNQTLGLDPDEEDVIEFEENTTPKEKDVDQKTEQPKQTKTLDDLIKEVIEPTPGSHFDENGQEVIDDPEVYQKALEKEREQREKELGYQKTNEQPEDRGPLEIFYRVYKYNHILGVLFFIFVVYIAIVLLRFRNSLRKKKEQKQE